MHAGNTVSAPNTTDTGADPLPGSTSEATEGVATHSPAMDIAPASQAYHAKLAAAPDGHPAHMWADVCHADDDTPNFGYPDR
jgi:hypothetical protein